MTTTGDTGCPSTCTTDGGHVEQRTDGGRARRAVVTGAAGFIGSHLVDALLARGCEVVGIDNLDPWYGGRVKLDNLAGARSSERFSFRLLDLSAHPPDRADELWPADVDVVFHLAGRPGVQDSWGAGFAETCQANVLLAQRVFEAALSTGVGRVVLASSSSVYGNGATSEAGSRSSAVDGTTAGTGAGRPVAPVSPYGVSKAAAEQLAAVYGHRGLDVVSLRYFTVYGPRQRPDMAFHRLCSAIDGGPAFPLRGSGRQRREFTYVADVVSATCAVGLSTVPDLAGSTFDVGGGSVTALNEVIALAESLSGRPCPIEPHPTAAGDPDQTTADLAPITTTLGWRPATLLAEGLAHQLAWHRSHTAAREREQIPALITGI